jgi:Xaa-Pro aminopeptidase
VAQFDDLMAKMHEAVNQTNKALSEATNAKVAANEARDLARKALSEATNAKVAAREGVARISTVSGGSGATADQIVDELADRLKEQP